MLGNYLPAFIRRRPLTAICGPACGLLLVGWLLSAVGVLVTFSFWLEVLAWAVAVLLFLLLLPVLRAGPQKQNEDYGGDIEIAPVVRPSYSATPPAAPTAVVATDRSTDETTAVVDNTQPPMNGGSVNSNINRRVSIIITPVPLKYPLYFLALAAFSFVAAIGTIVGAPSEYPGFVADRVVSFVAALLFSALCLAATYVLWLPTTTFHPPVSNKPMRAGSVTSTTIVAAGDAGHGAEDTYYCCCTCCTSFCCCSACALPFLACILAVAMFSACASSHGLVSGDLAFPGARVRPSMGGPVIHVLCEDPVGGVDPSKPTVVFLHGWMGSALDASWLRADPAVLAKGLRFCSLDRPGYGWSDPYGELDDDEQHFGWAAAMTQDVLTQEGVSGDIILVYHSLGGFHALSFARQLRGSTDMVLRGGVAIDALDPSAETSFIKECTTTADVLSELHPWLWHWIIVRSLVPFGIPRLVLLAMNSVGFTDISRLPAAVEGRYTENAMRPKYYQATIEEGRRWELNCGYAKEGEPDFGAAAFEALEVIVVPSGVDERGLADLNANSNLVVAENTGHTRVLFDEADCALYVAPALVRVIEAVAAADAPL